MSGSPASVFWWIVGFALIACAASVIAAAVYLALPRRWRSWSLKHLVSFATGVLLGASFVHLLPEALAAVGPARVQAIMLAVLAGIGVFFILEKALIWRHAHHDDIAHADHDTHQTGALIIIGDAFHNFLDGILITVAFVSNIELGIITGIAILSHEIPQEIGDFAILLNDGYSVTRAFLFNLLSSFAMVIGALAAWWWLGILQAAVPYILAFTAASFIYIAVADLIPDLHRGVKFRDTASQSLLIGGGIAFNVWLANGGRV